MGSNLIGGCRPVGEREEVWGDLSDCLRRRIREQIDWRACPDIRQMPGKSTGVDGMTISSQVQIKKNTENAGIPGFPEWNVNFPFSPVPVPAWLSRKRAGSMKGLSI